MNSKPTSRPRYIVTGTGNEDKPFGVWDRTLARFVASYADERDAREALVTYYSDDAKPAPTTPDNVTERRELAAIIARYASDDYVTTTEAASVLAWCREWAEDCQWADTTPVEVSQTAARELLRACERHIDGGLAFVLADVRRLANDKRQGIDRSCPACAAQNEPGPWPNHSPGCPDAPTTSTETIGNVPLDDYSADGVATMREHLALLSDGKLNVERQHSGTEDGPLWYVTRNGERTGDGGWMYEADALRDAITMTREPETAETRRADLARELGELEALASYGREHPYAGACGDDDARADRIAELRFELAVADAECVGFTVWSADGPRAAECVSAAVSHARVTGSVGATYSIGGEATPVESTATVRRSDKGAPEGHTITVPKPTGWVYKSGELRAKPASTSTPAPWADLPQSTRDTYAARWAREAYAGDVPELVTDSQALTLVALAEHCGESWQCSPIVSVAAYGDAGYIVAVFSCDSPAPNPIVRMWAGGDAYSAMNESDYAAWVGKLRADHGRVIVERADDAAYVIAPGGTYEPAPARFGR